ncbi:hypothetical protein ALP75_200446 [Pseudomonas syringae pv. actinidiae]|nr:hypothetical protein ALP75_200446 [Pseudomonas syringae pv. actinidiae]
MPPTDMLSVTPKASRATMDNDCRMMNRLPTRKNAGSAIENSSTTNTSSNSRP